MMVVSVLLQLEIANQYSGEGGRSYLNMVDVWFVTHRYCIIFYLVEGGIVYDSKQ